MILDVPDPIIAEVFYTAAFGLDSQLTLRAADAPTTGFRGLTVAKSVGSKYVQFATGSSPVKLALYGHRALAKVAGVPTDGSGSHRITIVSDLGPFTDPDGFAREPATVPAVRGKVAPQAG